MAGLKEEFVALERASFAKLKREFNRMLAQAQRQLTVQAGRAWRNQTIPECRIAELGTDPDVDKDDDTEGLRRIGNGIPGRDGDTIYSAQLDIARFNVPQPTQEIDAIGEPAGDEVAAEDATLVDHEAIGSHEVFNISPWGPQDIDESTEMGGGDLGPVPIHKAGNDKWFLGHVHYPPVELRIKKFHHSGSTLADPQFDQDFAVWELDTEYAYGDPAQAGVVLNTPTDTDTDGHCAVVGAGVWFCTIRIHVTSWTGEHAAVVVFIHARKTGTSEWIPIRFWKERLFDNVNTTTVQSDSGTSSALSGANAHTHVINPHTHDVGFGPDFASIYGTCYIPLSEDDYEIRIGTVATATGLAAVDVKETMVSFLRLHPAPWSYNSEWSESFG